MYIRPNYRGRGIGKKLLEYLFQEATIIGYRCTRLDSARLMDVAHSLYRPFGFRDIDPYPDSEIPKEIQEHWVLMEKTLLIDLIPRVMNQTGT